MSARLLKQWRRQPLYPVALQEEYKDALFVYTPWAGVLSPYGAKKAYTGTLPTISPSPVGQIGNFGGTQFIEVTGTSGAFPNGFSVLTVAAPKSTAGSANIDLTVGRPGGYLNFGYFEFAVFNRYASPNSQVNARGKPSTGDTSYSFYSSGVKLSSLTTTANRYYSLAVNFSGSFDASSNMRLGCPTDSNGQPNIALTVVFPRLLSEAELQALSANPWQIFQPIRGIPVAFDTGGGAQTLTPSLYTNNQTFYSPTVTPGAVTLSPSLYTNQQTFYTPTLTATVTVNPSLYTNNQTFYGPTATPGTVTLQPALYTNTQSFYAPSVSQAGAIVYPSLFTNTNIFFAAEAINEYPDPSQVEFGVKYGPGGTLVGTLTGGGGSSIIRLRSFTERH